MIHKFLFATVFSVVLLLTVPSVYANSVSVTSEIPPLTILSGETIPLLDTSANGNLTSLSVTANLPCDDNNVPLLTIVGGILGDTTNIIESSSDLIGNGIRNTCLYSDSITNVTAVGLSDLNRVFLNHTGSDPVHIPQGVIVTLTGSFPVNTTQTSSSSTSLSDLLSDLEVWFDASNSTAITTSGSDVTQWDDQSGNGNHVTNSGEPTLVTAGQNGLDYISFDGGDDELKRSTFTQGVIPQPYYVFGAYNPTRGDNDTFLDGSSNTRHQWNSQSNPSNDVIYAGASANYDITISNGWQIQVVEINGVSSNVWVDGVLHMSNGDVGGQGMNGVIFANHPTAANQYADVDWGELLIYPGTLTDEERETLENYLSDKWIP